MGILSKFLGIIGSLAPKGQNPVDAATRLLDQTMPKDSVAWRRREDPFAPRAMSATNTLAPPPPVIEPPKIEQPLTADNVGPINPVMPTQTEPLQGLRRPTQQPVDDTPPPAIKPTSLTQLPQPSQFVQPAAPQQYTPEQMQQIQTNILRTGLPGDPIAEQKAREAAVAKTRETVPMFGQPGAVPPVETQMGTAMGPSLETPAPTPTSAPAPAPAPTIEAPAATLGTAVSPRRMQTLADTGRPTFTLDGRQVVLGANGDLVTPEGQPVTNLSKLGGQVYMGKEVAVVGNDLVDMQGNKVGNFSDAYNNDRDFRFAYNLKSINERRANAAQQGDRQALLDLDTEEEVARLKWEKSRPKDTTRSFGDVIKGVGLGALKGFMTGGLGGALGGAVAGGVGTAINPELRQRLQDEMIRMPQAQGRLAQAQAAQEAGQKLELGRLGVLGSEQNLQQNIIQTRATALQEHPIYKKYARGGNITAEEIKEMEGQLRFSTGLKPGFLGGQIAILNGQKMRISADGIIEAVRDRAGNPVYDLVNTVVTVRDPKTGAVYYDTSERQAAQLGQWAVAQFNAEVNRRKAVAQAEAKAAEGEKAEFTPSQRREVENKIGEEDDNIEILNARELQLKGPDGKSGLIGALKAELAQMKSDPAQVILQQVLIVEKEKQLRALENELQEIPTKRKVAENKKKRYQTQLGIAVAPPAQQ